MSAFSPEQQAEIDRLVSLRIQTSETLIRQLQGLLAAATAPGTLRWAAYTAPDVGWLLCDGSAVSRTAAATAALFAKIGTTYGVGDGSTTFNLPDARGRTPIGAGTGTAAGASAWALGSQPTVGRGGEETHVLVSPGEIPAHNHTITDPQHSHGYNLGGTGIATQIAGGPGGTLEPPSAGGITSNTTGITINNTGSGGAHNNMQPVSVMALFIKL